MLLIQPYRPETDRAEIRLMLSRDAFFLDLFDFRERQGADEAWVARDGGEIAGFVSHAGRYLRARFTGYVAPRLRGRGIGAQLLEIADEYYAGNNWTERASCSFPDAAHGAARLLARRGFSLYCAQSVMERAGDRLPESGHEIRCYADADFAAYSGILDTAFWILRERCSILPNFYVPMGDAEREAFRANAEDRFVLAHGGAVVAAGFVSGDELRQLAVRPDLWGRGYGRALTSHMVNILLSRGHARVRLHCVAGNPARNLYRSLGFEEVGSEYEYAKYYRPESRVQSPPGLKTPEAVVSALRRNGKI